MTEQITVGYDGAESSSEAVLWAAQEAIAAGHRCTSWPVGTTGLLATGAAAFPEAGALLSSRTAIEAVLQRMVDVVERWIPTSRSAPRPSPVPRRRFSGTASRSTISSSSARAATTARARSGWGAPLATWFTTRPVRSWWSAARRVVVGQTASSSASTVPRHQIGHCGGPLTRRTSTTSSSPSSTVGRTRTRRGRTPPSRRTILLGSTPPACSRRRSAALGMVRE